MEDHHCWFIKKGKMMFFNGRNYHQNKFSEVQFVNINSARNKFGPLPQKYFFDSLKYFFTAINNFILFFTKSSSYFLAPCQQFTGCKDSIQQHFYINLMFWAKTNYALKEEICWKKLLCGHKSGNDKPSSKM